MSTSSRLVPRLRQLCRTNANTARPFTTASRLRQEEWPQKFPIGAYYENIIQEPPPYPFEQKPEEPPKSADPEVLPENKQTEEEKKPQQPAAPRPAKKKPGRKPKNGTAEASAVQSQAAVDAAPVPSPPPTSAQEKAKIVFGTRLAGPTDRQERLASRSSQSSYVAGVLVPPRPEEPDNCCMSGCVNCVWDLFREEMEEFTAKSREAQSRLAEASSSMDADGGGSSGAGLGVNVGDTKIAKDMWDDDVFRNVPVGIREFMKQEKRLKEQHERDGTSGS